MNPSKTAILLIVGLFLPLLIWWWATPASPEQIGLEGVRLLATNKVLTTISTIQQIFVPSVHTPPTDYKPQPAVQLTPIPTMLDATLPPGNHNGNGPPPAPPGRPDKDKDRDKHGNHGQGHDDDDEGDDDDGDDD